MFGLFEKKPRTWVVYDPKDDITTWELAQVVSMLLYSLQFTITGERAAELLSTKSAEVQRHFRVVKD